MNRAVGRTYYIALSGAADETVYSDSLDGGRGSFVETLAGSVLDLEPPLGAARAQSNGALLVNPAPEWPPEGVPAANNHHPGLG